MRIVRSDEVGEATLLLPAHLRQEDVLTMLHAALRLSVADLTIDLVARAAWRGDRRLALTPREFSLLAALARAHGAPLKRATLLGEIWGNDGTPGSNHVDVHLSRLRMKLAAARSRVRITTLKGEGWQLVIPDEIAA